MSTKAPKSTTLRTVPCKVMPTCKSFISVHILPEHGGGQLITGVTSRFQQFSSNVLQGGLSHAAGLAVSARFRFFNFSCNA